MKKSKHLFRSSFVHPLRPLQTTATYLVVRSFSSCWTPDMSTNSKLRYLFSSSETAFISVTMGNSSSTCSCALCWSVGVATWLLTNKFILLESQLSLNLSLTFCHSGLQLREATLFSELLLCEFPVDSGRRSLGKVGFQRIDEHVEMVRTWEEKRRPVTTVSTGLIGLTGTRSTAAAVAAVYLNFKSA